MLTITSRANREDHEAIDQREFEELNPNLGKQKKFVVITARVHPGETVASFIMEGFLKFITGSSTEAAELRKRIVFKVVPMTNPDGVIVGNYRTSLSGNDLNRQFLTPNPKLHPVIHNIKKLLGKINERAKEPEPIASFVDIHGHSRKKSIFMYGPSYPLHSVKYFKMRVLPKLLDAKSEVFRYYSCKFKVEKSKLRAARVVVNREFNVMACFTLEASMYGYIAQDRATKELTPDLLKTHGADLGVCFSQYSDVVEDEARVKAKIRSQITKKKEK